MNSGIKSNAHFQYWEVSILCITKASILGVILGIAGWQYATDQWAEMMRSVLAVLVLGLAVVWAGQRLGWGS